MRAVPCFSVCLKLRAGFPLATIVLNRDRKTVFTPWQHDATWASTQLPIRCNFAFGPILNLWSELIGECCPIHMSLSQFPPLQVVLFCRQLVVVQYLLISYSPSSPFCLICSFIFI